jgi:hypothetical protein
MSTALLTSLSATVLVLLASVTLRGTARAARSGALVALGVALFLLLLRLPLPALFALLIAAAGFLQVRRLRHRRRRRRGRPRAHWNATTGRRTRVSRVKTAVLEMTLDQADGSMRGTVLSGPHAGASLDALSLAALLDVAAAIQSTDTESLALMTAYLDRTHPGWSDETAERAPPANAGAMTREQAFEVLGLAPGATAEQINEAHRRLIKRVHPDVGWSAALAAHINAARARLL